jgi:hypothetical protein
MKGFTRLFTAALLSCAAVTAHAQTELQSYVQKCQSELQFAASEVKPMNCNDGPRFALGGKSPVNDFVVAQRVNQNVDMVAACRWGDGSDQANNTKFLSIEMLIHNRATGGTCFFAARNAGTVPSKPVASAIVPVTNFGTSHPNANDYWLQPSQMANKVMLTDVGPSGAQEKLVCVRCHSQGPYVASARIAQFLANYGLLNDGHHTYSNFAAPNHYFVVGSRDHTIPDPGAFPLGNWNFLIAQHNQAGGCSSSCHALARTEIEGSFSPIGNLTDPADINAVVLPSIVDDIRQLSNNGMAPDEEDSPYRWINIDQPSSDSAEVETFTASKAKKIAVTGYCGAPTWIEANAIGTDAPFSNAAIAFMPDKLRSFNLRDGLQCLNADQPGGKKCSDYQVSYKCPSALAKWVGPFNKDTNYSDDGDHEERSRVWADARAACGNKDPVALRADALLSGSIVQSATAPADRLAQFNSSGLVCRNADQGSGQSCSSYSVRYRGCRDSDDAQLVRIKNAWVSPPTFGDRYLTTTNNVDGAETRAQANNYQYPSQDWIIEHVPGGNVRLYDVWSGKFLTASSGADPATVVVKNSDGSLTRQLWIMETLASGEVRFRNVGTGKYLTVGNYTSDPYFAPMLSQTLSPQNWASQRWLVQ